MSPLSEASMRKSTKPFAAIQLVATCLGFDHVDHWRRWRWLSLGLLGVVEPQVTQQASTTICQIFTLGGLAAEAEDDVKDREAGISVLKRMTRNWHPVADSVIPSAYVYTGLSKTPRDSNLEHLTNIRLFHVCPLHPLPLPSSITFNLNIRCVCASRVHKPRPPVGTLARWTRDVTSWDWQQRLALKIQKHGHLETFYILL